MRVSDSHLDELRTEGFTVVEGFLEQDELSAAQAQLWNSYPLPKRSSPTLSRSRTSAKGSSPA
jgi:hypothetical protein